MDITRLVTSKPFLVFSGAVLCLVYYACGIGLTIWIRILEGPESESGTWAGVCTFLAPYLGICLFFVACGLLVLAKRIRSAGVALLIGLALSVAMCAYDFRHHRYQSRYPGRGHVYYIWWWYSDPFWHGYKPGNV